MVKVILAVWKVGGAYIPIDVVSPTQRILEILSNSESRVLITESKYVSTHMRKIFKGLIIKLDEDRNEINNEEGGRIVAFDMNSLAYVIYTSGSTGKPKGAMIEHIGMMNHISAKIRELQITDKSIVAQNASHTFDISVWQFFVALVAGGKTIIYSDELVFDPDQLIRRIIDHQVTILEVVPSYLKIMLECLTLDFRSLNNLDFLLVTGETLPARLVKRWFEMYPSIKMVNAYGPTEASDDITHLVMDKELEVDKIPIGKPIQNLNIYIIDQNMNLCPIGVKGEICVSGVGVGRGYLNNDAQTRIQHKDWY